MFYKVPEFPDKMSTDHEDQVLGKQRPGPESKWADIDWDPGRDWKDSGGTQMITCAEYFYQQRIF